MVQRPDSVNSYEDVAASPVLSVAAAANSGTPERDARRNFGISIRIVELHFAHFSEFKNSIEWFKTVLPTFVHQREMCCISETCLYEEKWAATFS